jgi:hypothetical protein
MFSRIVPPNIQVSCSTIPIPERRSARAIVAMSDAVQRDPAPVSS